VDFGGNCCLRCWAPPGRWVGGHGRASVGYIGTNRFRSVIGYTNAPRCIRICPFFSGTELVSGSEFFDPVSSVLKGLL